MSTTSRRALTRPLPRGLRLCPDCGEARGTGRDGMVSACFCSGFECRRCGERVRRPITDYFDVHDRQWWHVAYFGLLAHRTHCPAGSTGARADDGTDDGWIRLEPDPDVVTYQEEVTRLALSELRDGDEIDLVDGDRWAGRTRFSKAH